ncbi:hypothetical protein [Clostridium sp.]|uniref:hypothetical protein n=1 Tax=Clostridium sp. TaxID=1506 RepID=UPI0026372D7E|nr:hypothetical protein [Clostridium sp.]
MSELNKPNSQNNTNYNNTLFHIPINNPINLTISGNYELVYKRNTNPNNLNIIDKITLDNTINNNTQWNYHTFIRQSNSPIHEQKINIIYLLSSGLDNIANTFINDTLEENNPKQYIDQINTVVIGFRIDKKNNIHDIKLGYID